MWIFWTSRAVSSAASDVYKRQTTLLAMNQISIKNIGVIHNREFEEGVLRIEYYDEDSRNRSAEILRKRNYIIRKTM